MLGAILAEGFDLVLAEVARLAHFLGVRREAATVVQGTTIKMSSPTLVTDFSIIEHGWPVSQMMGVSVVRVFRRARAVS